MENESTLLSKHNYAITTFRELVPIGFTANESQFHIELSNALKERLVVRYNPREVRLAVYSILTGRKITSTSKGTKEEILSLAEVGALQEMLYTPVMREDLINLFEEVNFLMTRCHIATKVSFIFSVPFSRYAPDQLYSTIVGLGGTVGQLQRDKFIVDYTFEQDFKASELILKRQEFEKAIWGILKEIELIK